MDKDVRRIVLDVAQGDSDSKPVATTVVFCESSASLQVDKMTIHIPWTELATWQLWVAGRVEDES